MKTSTGKIHLAEEKKGEQRGGNFSFSVLICVAAAMRLSSPRKSDDWKQESSRAQKLLPLFHSVTLSFYSIIWIVEMYFVSNIMRTDFGAKGPRTFWVNCQFILQEVKLKITC